MSHCRIHNVGFYSPEARAVYCMALNKQEKKIALSRSDASIEIWNLTHNAFIERTIAPSVENFSVEGLAWSNNRLFSVGLHGCLIEYDLYKLCVKDRSIVTGESAISLDVNKSDNLIAVGTDLGYINLFRINDEGVQFEKFLDKQEGRILSIRFDTSGEFLVTGSINAIRIFNVNSGHAIHKMQLGRSEAKKDTIVWCLEVSRDFTIFSGDSRGVLTLWDGKMGSQIENYQSHKADITALCLSENEDSLYCAGVDPLITNYVRINVKGDTKKWVKSIQRKIHDHDVRALIFFENKLYSAGLDSYLACSYHPPKTLVKYAPVMQSPCVQLACEARLILLRYPKHIEIWFLGSTEPTENNFRGMVPLKSRPKKLVTIQRTSKNWNDEDEGEGVVCSCISRNGKWILVGTTLGFRIYRLVMDDDIPKLIKMDDLEHGKNLCVKAVFNDKMSQVICALNDGHLAVYDIKGEETSISQTISYKNDLEDSPAFLTLSSCGKYVVLGDVKANIVVYTYKSGDLQNYTKLPRYTEAVTALAVHPTTLNLVVAYADSKVIEYSIKKRKLTEFSRTLEKDMPQWKSKGCSVRSITFDPRRKGVILLHDDSNIFVFKKENKKRDPSASKDTPEKSKKTKKLKNGESVKQNGIDNVKKSVEVKLIQKYKHLVQLGWLSTEELVAVEINPLRILEKLPPAYAQKSFGTK